MTKAAGKRPKRIKRRAVSSLAVLAASIAVAMCAVVLAFKPGRLESPPPSTPVRVASSFDTVLIPTPLRPIAKGEHLAAVPFAETEWPKSRLSDNYIRRVSDHQNSTALTPLPAHLPIPITAVSMTASKANAVVEGIPEGMRAITVNVDAEAAVEGWARSGDYVDVIVLRQSKNSDVGMEAKVIAENVKILSAGRSTEPLAAHSAAPRAPATVTLLVTQMDALKVKTAASVGRLTLALRGAGDQAPTLAKAMSQKSLLGNARTFIPKKADFRGKARGPDGKTYVLGTDSRWIRSAQSDLPSSSAENSSESPTVRARLEDPSSVQDSEPDGRGKDE